MKCLCLMAFVIVLWMGSASGFEVECWPGEGRPALKAVARKLPLHERPYTSSTVVKTLTVSPGQKLTFDVTRYRTILPGRVRVLAPSTITGRMAGPVDHLTAEEYYSDKFPMASVPVTPSDTVEYLQYRAEGTCYVRVAGKVIEADPCPDQNRRGFVFETEPTTEWWVRILIEGKPTGWLRVTDDATIVNREF